MKFVYKIYSGLKSETYHGTTHNKQSAIRWADEVGKRHGGGKVIREVTTEETVYEPRHPK